MKWILVLLLVASLVVTAFVVGEIAGSFAASDRYSSYRGGNEGAKALYLTLLELKLEPVRLFESPERAGLDGVLFILLDPAGCQRLGAKSGEELLAWVQRGNTLVVAHAAPIALLAPLLARATWPDRGEGRLAEAAEAGSVRVPRGDPVAANRAAPFATLRRPGRYQVDHGGYAVLLGTGADPAAVIIGRGAGWVVLVSDPWLFSNAGLREEGNLELALGLVGHRGNGRIGFQEDLHGFTAGRSIVGYLRRRGLQAALVQALVVLLVAVLAWRGRRLSELRRAEPAGPGSRDFLEAMGRIYASAGNAAEAAKEAAGELLRESAAELRLGKRRPLAEVLQAIACVDRKLAGEVAAVLARGEPARWTGRGRQRALVSYHNQTLALAERLREGVRGGGRTR